MNIRKNIELIRQNIQPLVANSQDVNIVAATKYANEKQIIELYESGITKMGENRVDSLLEKKSKMLRNCLQVRVYLWIT